MKVVRINFGEIEYAVLSKMIGWCKSNKFETKIIMQSPPYEEVYKGVEFRIPTDEDMVAFKLKFGWQ